MRRSEPVCIYRTVKARGKSVDGSDARTRVDDVSSGVRKWTCDGEWLTSLVRSWLLGCCFPLALPNQAVDDVEPEVIVVT